MRTVRSRLSLFAMGIFGSLLLVGCYTTFPVGETEEIVVYPPAAPRHPHHPPKIIYYPVPVPAPAVPEKPKDPPHRDFGSQRDLRTPPAPAAPTPATGGTRNPEAPPAKEVPRSGSVRNR